MCVCLCAWTETSGADRVDLLNKFQSEFGLRVVQYMVQ